MRREVQEALPLKLFAFFISKRTRLQITRPQALIAISGRVLIAWQGEINEEYTVFKIK